MKRWASCLLAIGVAWGAAGARAAEEAFSQAVRPEDFSAAGLAKLSPDEIARLDRLVRDYKSGALEAARREADAAARVRAEAEARAAKAEAAARAVPAEKKPTLLERAKVKLAPGTEVEYAAVESRLAGEFRGWEGRTIFTLENGQRWQANASDTYVTAPIASPAVKIAPGAFGSFWMTVEGVKPRVRVVPVGSR